MCSKTRSVWSYCGFCARQTYWCSSQKMKVKPAVYIWISANFQMQKIIGDKTRLLLCGGEEHCELFDMLPECTAKDLTAHQKT